MEFQGSLLGCKLLFLKAVEGKVAPNLKMKGHNLGACRGKVPSWRADLCVVVTCRFHWNSIRNTLCVCARVGGLFAT